MKKSFVSLFIAFIFSTNLVDAQFNNPGPVSLCINGSYYLNPTTTNGIFSSANSSVATVDSRGYVTGISAGSTIVSFEETGVGTVSATITVGSTSNITITDPTVLPNYKFDNNPHGPIGGTINYVGYKDFNYSSQTQPTNTGYYRASKQVGTEAGCAVPFYIIKCDACVTVVLTVLTIGQAYEGGIVFYVTDGGAHGLIAATADLNTRIRYGTYTSTLATGTAIGTGLTNTNAIIATEGPTETSYAAGLARAYRGGEYADWYLPSKDELYAMYSNIGKGAALPNTNIGRFDITYSYWSSSEEDIYKTWFQDFHDGSRSSNDKLGTLNVRAIRAF
jgi:hypothetical protein